MWSDKEAVEFMRKRIEAHEAGKDDPPVCSMQERWNPGTQWAMMKKGSKRAIKLFETESQANAAATFKNGMVTPKYYVEERPGEDKRCKFYCDVWKFCSYGQLVHEK